MKNKKVKKIIEMHQHTDKAGFAFGRLHSVDALHTNKKTRKYHNETIEGEEKRA